MERTMHRLLAGLDDWRADLQRHLAVLDQQQLSFLCWELHRAAEVLEQVSKARALALAGHPLAEPLGEPATNECRSSMSRQAQALPK